MKGVLLLALLAVYTAVVSGQELDGCTEFELAMTYIPGETCNTFYRCALDRSGKQLYTCPEGQVFDVKYHNCRTARDGEC